MRSPLARARAEYVCKDHELFVPVRTRGNPRAWERGQTARAPGSARLDPGRIRAKTRFIDRSPRSAPLPASPRWGEEPGSLPQRGRVREGAVRHETVAYRIALLKPLSNVFFLGGLRPPTPSHRVRGWGGAKRLFELWHRHRMILLIEGHQDALGLAGQHPFVAVHRLPPHLDGNVHRGAPGALEARDQFDD